MWNPIRSIPTSGLSRRETMATSPPHSPASAAHCIAAAAVRLDKIICVKTEDLSPNNSAHSCSDTPLAQPRPLVATLLKPERP